MGNCKLIYVLGVIGEIGKLYILSSKTIYL